MSGPGNFIRLQFYSRATRLHPKTASRLPFSRRPYGSATVNSSSQQPSKWPRRLIYAGIFGGLGLAAGQWMDYKVSAPPVPGSEEDRREIARIHSFYENALPIVHDLRDNPDYVESDAYGNFTEEEKKHMLTSGPLRGSGGLALQKIFWNRKENKAISVVFLGRAIEGWPTVIHGGAIATLIDENLGRIAVRHFPEKTGVTANLEINYRRPMFSEQFYTLHTTIDKENSTERKAYTKMEVRDFTGRICTEAKGLFVVPKTLKLQKLGDQY